MTRIGLGIGIAVVATLAVVACSESTAPSIPQPGSYSLVAVNGSPLPVALMPAGCPGSIVDGTLAVDSVQQFHAHINWSGACPPDPPSPGVWDCLGNMPSPQTPTMDLVGLDKFPGECRLRVTGFGSQIQARWVGADSAIWGDPHFTFTH